MIAHHTKSANQQKRAIAANVQVGEREVNRNGQQSQQKVATAGVNNGKSQQIMALPTGANPSFQIEKRLIVLCFQCPFRLFIVSWKVNGVGASRMA